MSLPRSERKALREIEAEISSTDPGLAHLLGEFRWHAAGHAMPKHERAANQAPNTREIAQAVAGSPARLSHALLRAIATPGVLERLAPRMRPQPMARAPWQRLV